ncbi:DEAD/DEAH box helicase [Ceratobasidium sp. AG-Ba]|nr:DEAD/DEAH box helicase [Ceratobasidium sp. AG-Ba]
MLLDRPALTLVPLPIEICQFILPCMDAVALPSKFSSRALKRKQKASASLATRKRLRTAPTDDAPEVSDSEDDGLAWRKVTRPAGAMLGGGLDDDGGLLTIEEIDDVDVEYVQTEAGGRVAKLVKRGKSSSKASNRAPSTDKTSNNRPSSKYLSLSSAAEPRFDNSLLPEWESYKLHPTISQSLLSLSFKNPTPIQKASLPPARDGHDIIGVAETGSGKTLAYALPILHHILSQPKRKRELVALILAPTRELALQVCEHLKAVVSDAKDDNGVPYVSAAAIVGGLLRFLVLDEADRMVEAGHFQELDNIVKLTARKQESETSDELADDPTFVFSATLSKELQVNLARRLERKVNNKKSSTLDDLLMKLDFRDPDPKMIDLSPEYGKVSTLKESRVVVKCLGLLSTISFFATLAGLLSLWIDRWHTTPDTYHGTPATQGLPLHSQLQQRQRLKIWTDSIKLVGRFDSYRCRGAWTGHSVCRPCYTLPAPTYSGCFAAVAPSERGVMKGLVESLNRTEAIAEMPIEHDMLDRLKKRVQLARQIDTAQHKVKKDNHEKNWLKETAEALESSLTRTWSK